MSRRNRGSIVPRTLELSREVRLEERVLLAVDWTAQGPAPILNGQVEGMAAQSNPVAGAIHTVVAHPTDPNTLWVGSVNGGVWKTMNASSASPNWTPLTDYLPNQSIGALTLDPTDGSNNTILAGYGNNSSLGLSSGALQGVIRSTDGGTSWTQLGTAFFNGQGITGLAARGNQILVTTSPFGSVSGQVSRSTDAGLTWSNVSGTGGLPAGAAFDLAEDLTSLNRFYVSTTTGIFRTTDGGVNWTNITPVGSLIGGTTNNLELSVGRTTGTLFAAVVNNGRVATMWRTTNQGATWQQLDVPEVVETTVNNVTGATNAAPIVITSVNHGQNTNDRVRITGVTGNTAANGDWTITRLTANTFSLNGSVGNGAYGGGGTWQALQGLQPREHPGGQGIIHLSILADPTNTNILYVGGDRQPLNNGSLSGGFPNAIGATNFTGRLFRGDASQPSGSQWTPLTHNFSDPDGVGVGQPGTAPHADSRDMVFDAAGNLVQVDDGGVYKRSS
ncbi:MAG: WD40/YVTN/BNR-like repeat-containing protein, partial [Isosphaeraceae bacterium]